ncbi:MAG: PAS domain S-box protein, partial [Deltaproteobacteria bacterium]|nr:PAS domain S-box protein [Deltaproteobacteria bacterium]
MSQKPTYEELEQRIRELEHAESELKRSNDEIMKFRAIADKAVHGNAIADLDGTIVYLNDFFARVHGYTPDDLIGKDLSVFHNEKQLVDVRRINENLIKNGSYNALEVWHTHKDGTEFPMLMNAVVIYDGNGVPMYLGATGIDITERKQAEEALRESEEKYRSLITNIPDVTWTTDYEGKTSFISPNIEKEYGYTPEEITKGGDNIWLGRIHPEDAEKVEKAFKELFEEGTMLDVEYRIKRKDGEWIWLHDRSIAIYERDGVMYADGIFTNITERKRMAEVLQRSEEHHHSFMESAKGFIVYRLEVDPENYFSGRLIFVSPGIEDEIGVSPEAEFSEWFKHIHPDDVERIVEANIEAFKTLRFDETMRIYHPQKQKWIWIHSISTGFEDQEHQCYYVNGILIDVTREKEAEKALQESEEKFRLIAENSIDAIWQTGLNNKVTYISPSSINIGGYTPEEVMRFENALELYDDELRTLITTEMSKLLQKPVEELKRYAIPRIEGRALHKDGHKIWLEIQAQFIFEGNMIVGVQGISRDISERKESEEALRENEKRLNAILDATTETIVLFDRSGIVHTANQIVCERLETTKEELIGKSLYDFFPPDVAEGRRQKWNEVFDTGKPVNFEDSRKGMMFEQRAYPILDNKGQVEMVVAFANDKTDSKLAKESLRESEEKFRL